MHGIFRQSIMMKIVWARRIAKVANELVIELANEAPDLVKAEGLLGDIQLHTEDLMNKLKNEGVSIEQHIRE